MEQLPSVKPQEPKYCDRNICLKNEYNGIGCDECEVTKSQTDAVSRQLLLKLMGEEPLNWTDSDKELQEVEDYRNFRNMVEVLPSVNPQPTGHWILLDECSNSGYYCSECHKKVVKEGWSNTVKKIKYCPNCGARMVEPQESEVNNG